MRPQEPIHLRNRELLALRDQLLRRLDELQREQEAKKARSGETLFLCGRESEIK